MCREFANVLAQIGDEENQTDKMDVKIVDFNASDTQNARDCFALDMHGVQKVSSPPRKVVPMKPVDTSGNHECHAEQTAEAQEEKFCRQVATLLSRGNVSLQAGCFETKEDLDACWDSLKNYEF